MARFLLTISMVSVLTLGATAQETDVPHTRQPLIERNMADLLAGVLGEKVCSQCTGMPQVADGVYLDDPSRASEILQLLESSREKLASAFGELRATPIHLVCTTLECDERVGISHVAGQAWMSWIVYISSSGVDLETFVHEGVHAEVAHRTGVLAQIDGVLPMWFEEGMAVYFSHGLYDYDASNDLSWIMSTSKREDWDEAVETYPPWTVYAAAAETVHRIGETIGWRGILRVVDHVGTGATFRDALDREFERASLTRR